uniref:Uncharacterized protein n=1 Tax=Triticum urartu TaxID=4572 RepID=A0A8R7PUE5_TRIUA
MAGSGDDEDEEAMKSLYAGAAPTPAEEEEVDEGYVIAAMKAAEERGVGKEGLWKRLVREGDGP